MPQGAAAIRKQFHLWQLIFVQLEGEKRRRRTENVPAMLKANKIVALAGHANCVILRDSAIPAVSRFAVNALIAATFRRNHANLRSVETGFESR
jgi:hypothetical protein